MPREQTDSPWPNNLSFVLACLGAAAGLGSIWRFPYVAFENGGGLYLVAFAFAMTTIGLPLVILELKIGQWAKGSVALATAKMGQKWAWLGWWALLNSIIIVFYYSVVMAWCFQYFIYSITQAWGQSPEVFLFKDALKLSSSPLVIGDFNTFGAACLALIWITVFLVVRGGTRSLSRVLLFTVPIPVLILGIFGLRGVALPGGLEGVKALLDPGSNGLPPPNPSRIWAAAVSQVILALSLGMGQLVAYSSRKRDNEGLVRFGYYICVGIFVLSTLSGVAVFSIGGYLSELKNIPMADLQLKSVPLAFITYPSAISTLPWPAVWGCVFFLMLLLISIDSALAVVEANLSGINDLGLMSTRTGTIAFLCIFGFCGGLPFCAGAGLYWLDIVDHWVAEYSIVLIVIAQCLLFGFYGKQQLCSVLGLEGRASSIIIKIYFGAIIPLLLVLAFIGSFINDLVRPYQNYPTIPLLVGGWGVSGLVIFLALWLGRFPIDTTRNGSN